MSQAQIASGKKLTPEHRAAFLRYANDPAVHAKSAAARRGRTVSDEQRALLSRSNTGKKRTAETKARIGAASKGRKWSAKHKELFLAKVIGQKRTEEQRANYRIGAAKRLAKKACVLWFARVMSGAEAFV